MGNVFDDFAIDVLGKLYRSLGTAGGTYPPTFAGEGDKERVLAAVAIYSSGTVSEHTAVKVLVKGLYYLIPQAPILGLKPCLPLEL